jgi:hypothetical protein
MFINDRDFRQETLEIPAETKTLFFLRNILTRDAIKSIHCHRLAMHCNSMTSRGFALLLDIVPQLGTLILWKNKISKFHPNTYRALARHLSPTLKVLKIMEMPFFDCYFICKKLRTHEHLEHLDLSFNPKISVRAIVHMLKENKHLKTLVLKNVGLRGKRSRRIAHVLCHHNHTLTTLYLLWNRISIGTIFNYFYGRVCFLEHIEKLLITLPSHPRILEKLFSLHDFPFHKVFPLEKRMQTQVQKMLQVKKKWLLFFLF